MPIHLYYRRPGGNKGVDTEIDLTSINEEWLINVKGDDPIEWRLRLLLRST